MPVRGNHLRWPPRPGKRSKGTRTKLAEDIQQPSPQLPHERDTSADPEPRAPRKVIGRAFKDLAAGLVDTDCRNQAEQVIARSAKPGRRHR